MLMKIFAQITLEIKFRVINLEISLKTAYCCAFFEPNSSFFVKYCSVLGATNTLPALLSVSEILRTYVLSLAGRFFQAISKHRKQRI